MSQNRFTNKVSAFIGLTVLLFVIGFTIFMSIFPPKPIEEAKEESIGSSFEPFTQNELNDFWKLDGLRTDSVTITFRQISTYVKINRVFENTNLLYSSIVESEMLDSAKLNYRKEYIYSDNNHFNEQFIVNYGTLLFRNIYYDKYKYTAHFEDFEVSSVNKTYSNSNQLAEIGKIFLKYQIGSIETEIHRGNFTYIYLKDGRSLFLIKKNVETLDFTYYDDKYTDLIKNSKSLNDSTKIVYPY